MSNSKRKCANCKTYFRPERDFPGPVAWCGVYCGTELARKRLPKQRDKERKREKADARAEKRERLANSKPHQEKLTQEACNKLIRLLDHGEPCISCNEYRPLEAGHFRSVGSCPELRFCPLNIHGQCRPCNQAGTRRMNRGRKPEVVADEYERLLRERMGDEVVDWINGPHQPNHYSIEELVDMRQIFRAECRRIERGEPTKWDWRHFSPIAKAASQ